jgi:predicted PurR-regulated permease PerM
MKDSGIDTEKFRSAFVILLALGITAIFVAMIWEFLKALLLAAVFSGLLSPVYRRLVIVFRGRTTLASITTILLVLLLVLGPVSAFLGIVVKQAVDVSQSAIPWIKEQLATDHGFNLEKWLVERVPIVEEILPNRETVLSGMATIAQKLGNALVASASKVTAGTAAFFLELFIMLYAMFFFLIDGRLVLNKILYYTPLAAEDDEAMLHRFASITRATMKGTIVIALIQGALGGIAFWVAGIEGAAFWGTIMVLLSIVPGIGTPLVWIPAVIYLLVTGEVLAGVLLAIWCAGVVGSIDNVLRPTLVGKDAQMPDLLILLGTLGGIFMFGPVGFIIGPIICGLFVTVWDIYGVTFKEILPAIHRPALEQVRVKKEESEPAREEEK